MPEQLNDEEAGRFAAVLRLYMNGNHQIHRAYERGAVNESLWENYAAEAADLLSSPGGRLFVAGHAAGEWEYMQEILQCRRDEPSVDLSLGRNPIQRG